eukprot:Sspe_Gene.100097::Locus_74775_Transcript_1_1_Confidence_1.000_Length_1321::g.100097::m.100097
MPGDPSSPEAFSPLRSVDGDDGTWLVEGGSGFVPEGDAPAPDSPLPFVAETPAGQIQRKEEIEAEGKSEQDDDDIVHLPLGGAPDVPQGQQEYRAAPPEPPQGRTAKAPKIPQGETPEIPTPAVCLSYTHSTAMVTPASALRSPLRRARGRESETTQEWERERDLLIRQAESERAARQEAIRRETSVRKSLEMQQKQYHDAVEAMQRKIQKLQVKSELLQKDLSDTEQELGMGQIQLKDTISEMLKLRLEYYDWKDRVESLVIQEDAGPKLEAMERELACLGPMKWPLLERTGLDEKKTSVPRESTVKATLSSAVEVTTGVSKGHHSHMEMKTAVEGVLSRAVQGTESTTESKTESTQEIRDRQSMTQEQHSIAQLHERAVGAKGGEERGPAAEEEGRRAKEACGGGKDRSGEGVPLGKG